jgi:hypothetical protein
MIWMIAGIIIGISTAITIWSGILETLWRPTGGDSFWPTLGALSVIAVLAWWWQHRWTGPSQEQTEMRRAWTELHMTELNILLLASLGVSGVVLWAIIQIVMHGHVDTRSVATMSACAAVQGFLVYRIRRWHEKTKRELHKSG